MKIYMWSVKHSHGLYEGRIENVFVHADSLSDALKYVIDVHTGISFLAEEMIKRNMIEPSITEAKDHLVVCQMI